MEGKPRKIRVKKSKTKKLQKKSTSTTFIRSEITCGQSSDIKEEGSPSIRPADGEAIKDEIDEYLQDREREKEEKKLLEHLDKIIAEAEDTSADQKHNITTCEIKRDEEGNSKTKNKTKTTKSAHPFSDVPNEKAEEKQSSKNKVTGGGSMRDRPKWLETLSLPPLAQAKNIRILRKKIDKLEAIEQPEEKVIDELKQAKLLLQDIESIPRFSYKLWTDHIF